MTSGRGNPLEHQSIKKFFFSYLAQLTSESGFDPKKGYPKWSPVEDEWYFCRSTVRVQRAASLFKDVQHNLSKNIISCFLLLTYFPYLLTTFWKDSCLVDVTQFFSYLAYSPISWISLLTYYFIEGCQTCTILFCISLNQRFSAFSLLLLCQRMSGWVDLKQILFSYLVYSTLLHISLFTYNFIEGCQAKLTPKMFFVSNYLPIFQISLLSDYFFEGCQAKLTSQIVSLISRLVDPGSGFWPRFSFYRFIVRVQRSVFIATDISIPPRSPNDVRDVVGLHAHVSVNWVKKAGTEVDTRHAWSMGVKWSRGIWLNDTIHKRVSILSAQFDMSDPDQGVNEAWSSKVVQSACIAAQPTGCMSRV